MDYLFEVVSMRYYHLAEFLLELHSVKFRWVVLLLVQTYNIKVLSLFSVVLQNTEDQYQQFLVISGGQFFQSEPLLLHLLIHLLLFARWTESEVKQ